MTSTDPRPELTAPEVQVCPFPYYATLRDEDPVHRLPGSEVYLLTRHADVHAALRRPQVFSSLRPSLAAADPEIAAIEAQGWPTVPTLTNNDPPSHTTYRKLIKTWFTSSAVARREPGIRAVIDDLIDAFAGRGSVEFVDEFADRLPSYVVGDFIGQPRDMAPTFKRWARDITQAVNPSATREEALEYRRSFVDFQHYFAGEIERVRADPGQDFLSFLVTAEVDGEQLSVEALLDLLRVFINGGNETVASLLTNTMYYLLLDPEQLAAVLADHSLIPNAVEETIRLDTPGQWLPRTATDDVEVAGTLIPKGARVLMMLGSANRDAAVFPDPERFDIRRSTAGHLAYGFGIHFCAGAPIARLEARVAFEALLDRLPNIRVAVPLHELEFVAQPILRQLERLPLEFDAR